MKPILFKHRLEYAALRCVAPMIRSLPRSMAIRLGKIAGGLSRRILPGRRQLSQDNIRQALPELTEEQVEALVQRNFEQLGITAVEALRLDLFDRDSLDKYVDIEGENHLREALALERGVVILTAHLGFWEAGNYVLPALGVPLDTIAKPLKNRLIDAYFYNIRSHFGANIVNSRKGARRILKSLQAKRAVGLLLDQHIAPPGSIEVDFFGRKAYTTTAITNMAMKYQTPIVPTFCLRQPDNRYRVWFEPMILLPDEGDSAVAENTQYLTNLIEAAIRRDPGQWFWMHKRWRGKKLKKKTCERP